jgi:hypothetical protein
MQVHFRDGWLSMQGLLHELEPHVARCRTELGRSHGLASHWFVETVNGVKVPSQRRLMIRIHGHGSTTFNRKFLTELLLTYS